MDQGKKLTDDIIKLIASNPPLKHDGSVDVDKVMFAVASVYAGLARSFHAPEQAKDLLLFMADSIEDPEAAIRAAGGFFHQ
jgi:hypothetical protein